MTMKMMLKLKNRLHRYDIKNMSQYYDGYTYEATPTQHLLSSIHEKIGNIKTLVEKGYNRKWKYWNRTNNV